MLASIQRPQLFAVLFIALSLNGLATKIVLAIGRGWFEASLSLLGINAIVWAALAALIAIAAGQGEREPIRRSDWFVAAIALLCALAPVTALSGAMLVIASGWLAWSSRPRNRSWRIALIALALTGRVFWGKLALGLFGGTIATLETRIVPLLTGLQTDGNVMTAFDGSKTFVVAASCSSVANLSLVVILMVTAIQLFRLEMSRRIWIAMGGALLAVILLNAMRLALFGYFPQHFGYWHNGPGVALFGYGLLLVIGLFVVVGTSDARRSAA